MIRLGLEYTIAMVLLSLLIVLMGTTVVAPGGATGVRWGAGIAAVLQLTVFWALFVGMLRHNWALAHGLGMLIRFVGLSILAFLWIPAKGLPAGPTLLTFVGCLFASLLLEPVFLKRRNAAAEAAKTALLRTEH
jgi:hypothetical protein